MNVVKIKPESCKVSQILKAIDLLYLVIAWGIDISYLIWELSDLPGGKDYQCSWSGFHQGIFFRE